MKVFNVREDEEVCANCAHFHQHYGEGPMGTLLPLNCGHCVYPRVKNRCPGDTCDKYEKED